MEEKKLQERLKKFYEGTLSSVEEEELIRYFNHESVPEKFRVEQEMFAAFTHPEMKAVPNGLTGRMDRFIDSLNEKQEKRILPGRLFPLYAKVSGIAATVALLILSYFLFLYHPVKDTYSDPALAYAQTKETLLYVSSTLNSGTGQMKYLAATSKPAKELQKIQTLTKPVNHLSKLDEFNKGLQTLRNNAAIDRTNEILNKYLNINSKQK